MSGIQHSQQLYYSKVIETPSDTSSLWLEGVERIEALAEILSTPSLIAAKAKPRLLWIGSKRGKKISHEFG